VSTSRDRYRATGRNFRPRADRAKRALTRIAARPGFSWLSLPLGHRLNSAEALVHEPSRMLTSAFAYVRAERVPGDYAEFGVFRGATFAAAAGCAERFGMHDLRLWAFDSFAGLPELTADDEGSSFHAGQFAAPRAEFDAMLRDHRVDRSRVSVVEGMFDTSLAAGAGSGADQLSEVAIAWVDCDLYASTVPVLDYLTPRLADGAVIVFDDWNCYRARPDQGERRACAEWLEHNPSLSLVPFRDYGWAGTSMIVHRDPAAPPHPST
jgi:hypothetical protein